MTWAIPSPAGSPVSGLLGQRLATTLAVVGVAYVLSVLLAIPLGMLAATRPYSLFDQLMTTLALSAFSAAHVFHRPAADHPVQCAAALVPVHL